MEAFLHLSPCQLGLSGENSCTWICFKIYLFIIYFIWCMTSYIMRWTRVPPYITRTQNYEVHNVLLNLLELAFKGNPHFQGILHWILQILSYYCRKQHKNIKNSGIIEQNLVLSLPFFLFTATYVSCRLPQRQRFFIS